MKKRLLSLVLLLSVLFASACALSSCRIANLPIGLGVSVTNTEINEKGELIVSYSDGTEKNLGVVGKGEDDASAHVISAEINEKGELILHYSDNTTENLGVVAGGEAATPPSINDTDVTIEITGNAESATAAIAAAAPSIVSIYSNFPSTSSFEESKAKAGSGVFYKLDKTTGDAIVITNFHLVYNAETRKIASQILLNVYGSPLSSQSISATFVGGSMKEDVAVLRVSGNERLKNSIAKAAVLASSDALHPGDTAIAIGDPKGTGISATYGKVNIVNDRLDTIACDGVTPITHRVIRIDTAVNKGNSGGGLFDAEGKLIGIVISKIIEENIENIGFALPIDKVRALADNILDCCLDSDYVTPCKPLFGIAVKSVDSEAVVNIETGLIDIVKTIEVVEVEAGSLGEGKYLVGDRILSVTVGERSVEVTEAHHIMDAALDMRPGDSMTVKVLRDGAEVEIVITPPNSAYKPC